MKHRHKISVLFILILNFVFAQNSEWKNISNNFYQSTVYKKSSKQLQNQDSLKLTVFSFDRNEVINLSDSTKQNFPTIKMTFENFKEKLSLNKFEPELTSQSEFLIKYQTPERKIYEYEFYFLDSISKKEINDFQKYLNDNLEIQKLEYISKDDAMNEAAKSLGINAKVLFEGNIFPASIKIQTNKKVNTKTIENKFKNFIESSNEKNPEIGIHISKIET